MRFDENFPVYPSIGERAINLLLIEELVASVTFQSQFFEASGIGLRERADSAGVRGFTEVCLPGAEIDDVVCVADAAAAAGGKSAWRSHREQGGFGPASPSARAVSGRPRG